MTRPAYDEICRIVSHQSHDLFVRHVVCQRFARIHRATMDQEELATVFEGQPNMRGKSADSLHYKLSEGLTSAPEAFHAFALLVAPYSERIRIQRYNRFVDEPLDHDGAGSDQATPGFERFRSGKYYVTRHEEPVEASLFGRGQDGSQGVEMGVYVGDAQEAHEISPLSEV